MQEIRNQTDSDLQLLKILQKILDTLLLMQKYVINYFNKKNKL